jgi:hypothetical protein
VTSGGCDDRSTINAVLKAHRATVIWAAPDESVVVLPWIIFVMSGFAVASMRLIHSLLHRSQAARVITPSVLMSFLLRLLPLRFRLKGPVPMIASAIHSAKACSLLPPGSPQKTQIVGVPRFALNVGMVA